MPRLRRRRRRREDRPATTAVRICFFIRKSQEKCTSHIHQLSNVHHKLTLNIGPYDVISMCNKMMCITKSRCALFVQDDVHCYFNYGDI